MVNMGLELWLALLSFGWKKECWLRTKKGVFTYVILVSCRPFDSYKALVYHIRLSFVEYLITVRICNKHNVLINFCFAAF